MRWHTIGLFSLFREFTISWIPYRNILTPFLRIYPMFFIISHTYSINLMNLVFLNQLTTILSHHLSHINHWQIIIPYQENGLLMLSVSMITMQLSTRSAKIESIIDWNVAGELHIPKNITVGSNSPLLVLKAAFHWSPSFIRMLLYPHLTSSLLKNLVSFILSVSSGMSGSG